MVVKVVETSLDVTLYKPLCPGECPLQMEKRRMAAFPRTKSMGVFREVGLINAFQYQTDDFLYQLVICRRDTQRPLFVWVALLGNILPPCRFRLIAVVSQGCDNPVNSTAAHAVQSRTIHARGHTAVICVDIFIGEHVKLRVVQIAVKPLKSVRGILRFFA